MQARSRGGGEAAVTAARRALVAARCGAAARASGPERVASPARAWRDTGIVSPGGRAAGKQQVRAREGWGAGQDGRLSEGHDGHLGGAVSGQHPAGIAAAGAGRTAPTGAETAACRRPANSPKARTARLGRVCLVGMSHGL